MFSANENIVLRKHKRRVVGYVEECIPPAVLDAGTSVMVMQVSCKSPGCVPLETAVVICFPRRNGRSDPPSNDEPVLLMEGLAESRNGGNFKTKILLPLSDVTNEDVLDALPPSFLGGRRTMATICLRARDVALGQITQVMGDGATEGDIEGRRLMADYLIASLKEYMDRGCVAPEVGEPFPTITPTTTIETKEENAVIPEQVKKAIDSGSNFVVRRPVDTITNTFSSATTIIVDSPSATNPSVSPVTAGDIQKNDFKGASATATEWKQRQKISNMLNTTLDSSNSSSSIIQRLTDREHAPGIRRTGCPCCDPDNPSNVVDNMMAMM